MAKALYVFGIFEMVASYIVAYIISNMGANEVIPIAIAIVGIVDGVLFCSFGKVISLLEKSVLNQNKIIERITSDSQGSFKE